MNQRYLPVYSASWMGSDAYRFIKQVDAAEILGVTSKGVFLQNADEEIVFISGEAYRGPITINLQEMLDFKALFNIGESCQIRNEQIAFPGCKVFLNTAKVWEPPQLAFEKSGIHFAFQRGTELAGELIGDYRDGLFYPFLDALIGQQDVLNSDNLWDLIPKLNESDPDHILDGLLGYGGGLTPAGDDFICGFLLADHYLAKIPDIQHKKNTDSILSNGKTKTTFLSAALIRCAVQGKGDERVLNALRWIAEGQGEIKEIKKELRSYGSSSGVDTLAGMLAALLALDA